MSGLYNKKNKAELLSQLKNETFDRLTLSFYKYVDIDNPTKLRDEIYTKLNNIDVLGRIYIANEGINAQISIPEHNLNEFKRNIHSYNGFKKIKLKTAIEDGISFIKLIVKVKDEIVAYKISENEYNMENTGNHLNYKEFNNAIDNGALIVDMRNFYESEIGKFENAIIPDVDSSKELLPTVKRILSKNKEDKILMYCTGGIRCEKASSYLIHHGFKDVNQLDGGIIKYAHDIKANNEKSKFLGKNFVFDGRLGERITKDILSCCHQCDSAADTHINCHNQACHILFIQCKECNEKYSGCCSDDCMKVASLPIEEQKVIRKKVGPKNSNKHYKRTRLK